MTTTPPTLTTREHLAWLGVDAIWISPCFPSPMKDFGYDVADYCDIERGRSKAVWNPVRFRYSAIRHHAARVVYTVEGL